MLSVCATRGFFSVPATIGLEPRRLLSPPFASTWRNVPPHRRRLNRPRCQLLKTIEPETGVRGMQRPCRDYGCNDNIDVSVYVVEQYKKFIYNSLSPINRYIDISFNDIS